MSDRAPNRIEHLFTEAVRRPTKRGRSEFLTASCAGDATVRSRLEALLTAHDRAATFLETPISALDDWGFVLKQEFSREGEPGDVCPWSTPVADAPGSPSQADVLAFLDEPESPDELGTFSGYGVTELLGRGGAGIVLKARDRRLNRSVALKVLAPHWAAHPHARQRFLREARAAAAVRHEHVVAIHAIDESAALPFLVMEYIPGESLQERIRRDGPLQIAEVLRIGRQAAAGLAAVHAQRLVHRDVKPANILLEKTPGVSETPGVVQRESGHARITDFGLARTVDDVGITQEGMIAGTPQYMSPEQARGNPVDFRGDLFSLGSVLYAMCAGKPPFQAETTMAVMRRICEDPARPIGGIRPETPPELARLIGELLEKDPAKRPQTADDVASRLDGMMQSVERDTVADAASVRTELGTELEGVGCPEFHFPSKPLGWLNVIRGKLNSGHPTPTTRRRIMWGSLGAAAVAAAVGFGLWNKDRSESPDELTTRPEPTVPVKQPTEVARKSPVREKANRPLNALLFDASVAPLSEFRRMSVPGEQINALAVSPDGTRVYAGCTDGIIYVWDTRTGKEVRRYRGHKPSTLSILLSPDGTRMVTFGGDRVMRVHNTATGSQILTVRMGIPFRGAALSPDGTEVAVAFYGGKAGARLAKMSRPRGVAGPPPVHDQVSIFSTVTGERLRLLSTPRSDSFRSVDWSPDGRWIAAGIEEGRVLLLVAKTGAVEKDLKVLADDFPGPAHEVHFSRDGKRLFAAGSGNLVWGWEVPGGRRILRRRFMQGVVRFAASPDNRWLAFGGGLKIRMLSLRDSAGNAVDVNLEGHTSPSVSAAFVPDADVLVSYGWDGTVRLWRLPADTSPVDGSKKPLVRRLLGTDGYAADANFDGVFETVETKRPDLRVTRDDGAGILPREVALLEFDTKPYRGDDLVGAALEVKITLAQSSNVDPVFDLEVHAYPADGKVAVEDATAAGALAAKLTSHNRNSLGKLRIALDTPLIRKLMSQNGRVGLRISNTRGDRMIFAGRRYYVKDSAPVLELHLRPQR